MAAVLTGVAFGIVPALHAATPRLATRRKVVSSHDYTAAQPRSLGLVVARNRLGADAGCRCRTDDSQLGPAAGVDLGFEPEEWCRRRSSCRQRDTRRTRRSFACPKLRRLRQDSKPLIFFNRLEEELRSDAGYRIGRRRCPRFRSIPVGTDYDLPVIVEGRPRPRAGEEPQADFRLATASYFRTMRMPLIAGREFTEFDGPARRPWPSSTTRWRARYLPAKTRSANASFCTAGRARSSASSARCGTMASRATHGRRWCCPIGSFSSPA